MMRFPDSFLWGVATSSHQVEGHQTNDWSEWERQPGRIFDGSQCGAACDWWNGRAEEDLVRARDLSVRSVRLSLEWSRLEPTPGQFDRAAFERYRRILERCRELSLEPMVGLNHFTLPTWIARSGSWLSEDTAPHFARYAARCGEELREYATLWSTLNEPSVQAFMGYAGSHWPPGRKDPRAAARALRNQLHAHAEAARALRGVHPGARVGLVLNAPEFVPERSTHLGDRVAAKAQDWAFTGVVLDALARGTFQPPLSFLRTRVPELRNSFDWLGVNYYGRYRVRFDRNRPLELFGRRSNEQTIHTQHNDWGEVAPSGLTHQLLRLHSMFPKTPLYVTENGIFDASDQVRPQYLVDHVCAVHVALSQGADVRGYYVWTLVDNFEWAEGWSTPFGLFALDRGTQTRTARFSAEVYARICRQNGVGGPTTLMPPGFDPAVATDS